MLFFLLSIGIGCAKRGSINGGTKDTIAPVLRISFPKNQSVNFNSNAIKLTFDEYIKLKEVSKQLIVSPPLDKFPDIAPLSASKQITIKFKDTLLANTTYSLNFGESIQDYNEGNALKQFKYIFSTGTYIDSLSLSGTIKDAISKKAPTFVSVLLYEVNNKFNDSVIYKQKPRYITNTLDSAKTFKLENLKAGKYLLIALKDENNNNKFDSKSEKIGFRKQYITIPNDSLFQVALFKETPAFMAYKPTQASGNRLLIGYEGTLKNRDVTLKNNSEILPTIVTQLEGKDSVQVWFKPVKADSLTCKIVKNKYAKDFVFKIKNQKNDTLKISAFQNKILQLRERMTLKMSLPITEIDRSKIELINKDSLSIAFKTEYDDWKQQLYFDFQKEPLEKYKLKLLPGAITDFMGKKNDSLVYVFETKNTSEYGNLKVKLANVKQFPILVELTNSAGITIASAYSESETTLDFIGLEPTLFRLRVIYDTNKNKIWDAGNYLEKRQSEEVIYFSKEIDVRSNWDVEQVFDLAK